MITKITAYKCSNGRIFDNLVDAQRYETKLSLLPDYEKPLYYSDDVVSKAAKKVEKCNDE